MTDPNERRLIDAATVTQWLAAFGALLVCWKVGLHYGSTVYFEMGAKQKTRLHTGAEVDVGDAYLALNGYNWAIYDKEWTLATSRTITRELAETMLAERFIGQRLVGIDFSAQSLSVGKQARVVISFSDAPAIEIWTIPEEQEYIDHELFTLQLPNDQ